jgi:hypothetical protein
VEEWRKMTIALAGFVRSTTFVMAAALVSVGCGGSDASGPGTAGGSGSGSSSGGVRVKRADLPEKTLEVKTAYAINRGSEYSVRLADFDLDPTSDMIRVPAEKVAVYMSLTNADGSLPQAGQVFTFPATNGHKVNAEVYTSVTNREASPITKGSNKEPVGSVKVISIDGDTMAGEADLDNGSAGVKGKFTAKIVKRG